MKEEYALLSLRLVKSRNYVETKRNVDEIMYKFEEYRFKYHNILPPTITKNYEVRYESNSDMVGDKVGNFVQRKVDLEIEIKEFYDKLAESLKMLNSKELLYFKQSYLNKLTEEAIAELLNISRESLKRIKESCIIKIAMFYNIDVMATPKSE